MFHSFPARMELTNSHRYQTRADAFNKCGHALPSIAILGRIVTPQSFDTMDPVALEISRPKKEHALLPRDNEKKRFSGVASESAPNIP